MIDIELKVKTECEEVEINQRNNTQMSTFHCKSVIFTTSNSQNMTKKLNTFHWTMLCSYVNMVSLALLAQAEGVRERVPLPVKEKTVVSVIVRLWRLRQMRD